jgi:hypothetical protein
MKKVEKTEKDEKARKLRKLRNAKMRKKLKRLKELKEQNKSDKLKTPNSALRGVMPRISTFFLAKRLVFRARKHGEKQLEK